MLFFLYTEANCAAVPVFVSVQYFVFKSNQILYKCLQQSHTQHVDQSFEDGTTGVSD